MDRLLPSGCCRWRHGLCGPLTGGTVTLFYVLSMRVDYGPYMAQAGSFVEAQLEAESVGASMYLDRLAHSAMLEGVKTRKEMILGLPVETILTYTRMSQV